MDDQVVCVVTHQVRICCSSPGVRASCCGRSSLHGRLSPSAASPLWAPASERLPPPGPPLPQRTRGPRWHRCSAAPSAGHSDSEDGSCAKQISCLLCASFQVLCFCGFKLVPYRLPCRLRVFMQNKRTCPSRRTVEKQESSVEKRTEGKPSGQTPAHKSPLPQSSVSRMAKCCSITCWACWRNNKELIFYDEKKKQKHAAISSTTAALLGRRGFIAVWKNGVEKFDDGGEAVNQLIPFGWQPCVGTVSRPRHRRAAGLRVSLHLSAAGRTAGRQRGGGRPLMRRESLKHGAMISSTI